MPAESKVVVLIPARWGSVRFPGKPLALIRSKPMIQWVVENAGKAKRVDRVIVATDDHRIFDAVSGFGGEAMMTRSDHVSGSDRIAEVAENMDCDIVVNVQGDEPLISPDHIDQAVEALHNDPSVPVSSLMTRFLDGDDIHDPNCVKVVVDRRGHALYFQEPAFRLNVIHHIMKPVLSPGSGILVYTPIESSSCWSSPISNPLYWSRQSALSSYAYWKTGFLFRWWKPLKPHRVWIVKTI